jgi:hypothetical protein
MVRESSYEIIPFSLFVMKTKMSFATTIIRHSLAFENMVKTFSFVYSTLSLILVDIVGE